MTLLELGIAFADVHTFRALGIDDRPALLLGMNALQAFDSLTIDMRARNCASSCPHRPAGQAALPRRMQESRMKRR